MTAFTFHVNTACLLCHSVIVAHIQNTADFPQAVPELLCRYRLICQLFPSAAVDHKAMFQMELMSGFFQRFIKIFPDHVGESKDKDRSVSCLFKKAFYRFQIQRHVLAERIASF